MIKSVLAIACSTALSVYTVFAYGADDQLQSANEPSVAEKVLDIAEDTVEAEFTALVDASAGWALSGILNNDYFFPYAAGLTNENKVVYLRLTDKQKESYTVSQVVPFLRQQMINLAEENVLKASVIYAFAAGQKTNSEDVIQGIGIEMEHKAGIYIQRFIPFTKVDNDIDLKRQIDHKAPSRIFEQAGK